MACSHSIFRILQGLGGDGSAALLKALVGLITLILEGKTPPPICPPLLRGEFDCPHQEGWRCSLYCCRMHAEKTSIHHPSLISSTSNGIRHPRRNRSFHLQTKLWSKWTFKMPSIAFARTSFLSAVRGHIPDLLPFVTAPHQSLCGKMPRFFQQKIFSRATP